MLIERDAGSVTVGWQVVAGATAYELQMCTGSDCSDGDYKTLAASLKATYARKKNLVAGCTYTFRVRAKGPGDDAWSPYSAASVPLTVVPATTKQVAVPPRLSGRDSVSVSMAWEPVTGATGYRVRYRREDEPTWEFVATTVVNAAVKKKNLLPGVRYIFSVQPVVEGGEEWEYSTGSAAVGVAVLSPQLARILPRTLRTKTGTITTADALAGKVVLFYFSASWCGPCRQFTPQLASLYSTVKAQKKDCEVVFVSADHSTDEFEEYWGGHHPWPSINYDDAEREPLMGLFSVRGIPRLCVVGPNGQTLVDNAAQGPLSIAAVDGWIRMATA